jgi:hypothetical protein
MEHMDELLDVLKFHTEKGGMPTRELFSDISIRYLGVQVRYISKRR